MSVFGFFDDSSPSTSHPPSESLFFGLRRTDPFGPAERPASGEEDDPRPLTLGFVMVLAPECDGEDVRGPGENGGLEPVLFRKAVPSLDGPVLPDISDDENVGFLAVLGAIGVGWTIPVALEDVDVERGAGSLAE